MDPAQTMPSRLRGLDLIRPSATASAAPYTLQLQASYISYYLGIATI